MESKSGRSRVLLLGGLTAFFLYAWISFIFTPMAGDIKIFLANAKQAGYISNDLIVGAFQSWELKSVLSRLLMVFLYKVALLFTPFGTYAFECTVKGLYSVLLILFVLTVTLNLIRSRSGRAIMAVRDNRIAAESVGINVTKYKLMAFVTSAAMAGMAGALYALNYSSVLPKKFDFNTSILVLVFVVLGGMGNIRGSIIAATVLTILPEALRAVNDYRMLLYAIVLILVMLVTNNPTLKNGWNVVKEKLAFWRKKTPVTAEKGGGADE